MGINRIATDGSGGFGQPTDGGDQPGGRSHLEVGRHPDGADVSALASALSALQQLQRDDAGRFQQVMAGVAASLRGEACAAAGARAQLLARLADRFDQAARAASFSPAWLLDPGGDPGLHPTHGVQTYSAGASLIGAAGATQEPPLDLARIIQAALPKPGRR